MSLKLGKAKESGKWDDGYDASVSTDIDEKKGKFSILVKIRRLFKKIGNKTTTLLGVSKKKNRGFLGLERNFSPVPSKVAKVTRLA